jgi:predicted amidophosphoribosyltransferase
LDAREFTGVRLNRKVSDQALLNLQQRAANLAGAITVGPPPVPGTQLVLVDDVVTTGATIGEMYRAATESGWNCKFFVSFAETL